MSAREASSVAVDPLVGHVIDRRFKIDTRIAAGGFGAIYRATHIKSGHPLAIKVLHRELTHDPRVVARFRREGEALTTLRDPHTIAAYELGFDDGAMFIVMELLMGESLYQRFHRSGPLPWREVARVALAVCSSLAEAHARGLVHRDLKPANIHLEPRADGVDFIKVLDFGIAKILNGSGDQAELTNQGQMIGTFDYMSPEQMIGDCTIRSDIYMLGVVMYEMIAGLRPFDDAVGPTALLAALVTRMPPRLRERARVPDELDRIVMRCIEKEPRQRYPEVGELSRDLQALLRSTPEDDATVRVAVVADATAQSSTMSAMMPANSDPTMVAAIVPQTLSGAPAAPDDMDSTLVVAAIVEPITTGEKPIATRPDPPPWPPATPPSRPTPPPTPPSRPTPPPTPASAPKTLALPFEATPSRGQVRHPGTPPRGFPQTVIPTQPGYPGAPVPRSPVRDAPVAIFATAPASPPPPPMSARIATVAPRAYDTAAPLAPGAPVASARDKWIGRAIWFALIAIVIVVVAIVMR